MTSRRRSDWLELEKDLVTAPEDIQALRQHRPRAGDDWLQQLQALAAADPFPKRVRRRPTFAGYEPFEL